MKPSALDPGFREHLLRIVDVGGRDLDKIVAELTEHWSETADEFVRRRHAELQRAGVPNRLVYRQIADELQAQRVRVDALSERQVRRIIYG